MRKKPRVSKYQWDVFISHASEDKVAVARPLADALSAKGFRVWYDEFALKLGDSLRERVDHGLTNSRYGIVILSPSFFSKHWPQRELNGLATREVGQEKVILPIWHGVRFEDVRQYSAPLADRIATSTDKGLDYVIESLLTTLPPPEKRSATSPIRTAEYVRKLEAQLIASTAQWRSSIEALERSYDISLEIMGDGLDLRTGNTTGHSKRVTAFTIAIARGLGLSRESINPIARGAFLHDFGKTRIPDSILRKRAPLTAEEETQMRQYCHNGYITLKQIPFLNESAEMVYAQEERFDGLGYPRALRGKDIPIGARILAVAHALEVASGDSMLLASAQEEILAQSATRFDPDVASVAGDLPLTIWQDLREEILRNDQIESSRFEK